MKKTIGKLVVGVAFCAVMGVVGRMDYNDKQADADRTEEIRQQLIKANADLPPLDQVCLALNSPLQHCQTKHE